MKQGLILFNPYIGDSFIATALARHFEDVFEFPVMVNCIDREKYDMVKNFFIGRPFISEASSIQLLGSELSTFPLKNNFLEGGKFSYEFDVLDGDYNTIQRICYRVCEELVSEEITDLFILHYSFPLALLGKVAQDFGIVVHGYYLHEYGNKLLLGMKGRYGESTDGVIWSKDFIGDRLSKLITGQSLHRRDFVMAGYLGKVRRQGVTLFPTTRGNGLPTVEQWGMDCKILKDEQHWVQSAIHRNEELPEMPLGFYHTFEDLNGMAEFIQKSEFIICYDSASFHLAWYYGIPAIVKLKGGFNYEWIPRWVRNDPKYQFLEPVKMYDEEYYYTFKKKLEALEI